MDVFGYVPCNCHQRGVAKPPPVAVEVREGRVLPRGVLSIDEQPAYEEWCRTACTHSDLRALDELIGTVDSVRAFTHVLEQVGETAALLASVMPRGNTGTVEPTAADLCIRELRAFRDVTMRRVPHLIDTATERVVHAREGVFFEAQGGDVGFDAYGVFVADRRAFETRPIEERLRFRAKHVHVRPGTHGAVLRDLDSDATAECLWDPPGECELEVVMRSVPDPEYAETLDKLERLFTAAVLWQAPVYWR